MTFYVNIGREVRVTLHEVKSTTAHKSIRCSVAQRVTVNCNAVKLLVLLTLKIMCALVDADTAHSELVIKREVQLPLLITWYVLLKFLPFTFLILKAVLKWHFGG